MFIICMRKPVGLRTSIHYLTGKIQHDWYSPTHIGRTLFSSHTCDLNLYLTHTQISILTCHSNCPQSVRNDADKNRLGMIINTIQKILSCLIYPHFTKGVHLSLSSWCCACLFETHLGPVHANMDICLSIKKVNPFKISTYTEATTGMPGQQMVLQSTSPMPQIPEKSMHSEPLADGGLGYIFIFHGKFTKTKTYSLLSHLMNISIYSSGMWISDESE